MKSTLAAQYPRLGFTIADASAKHGNPRSSTRRQSTEYNIIRWCSMLTPSKRQYKRSAANMFASLSHPTVNFKLRTTHCDISTKKNEASLSLSRCFNRAAATGGKRGTEKKGRAAMDPMERIRSHLNAAKSTKRLDLSTWTDRKQGDFLLTRIPRTVRTNCNIFVKYGTPGRYSLKGGAIRSSFCGALLAKAMTTDLMSPPPWKTRE